MQQIQNIVTCAQWWSYMQLYIKHYKFLNEVSGLGKKQKQKTVNYIISVLWEA